MVTTGQKTTRGRRSKAEVQLALDNIIKDNADEVISQSSNAKAAERIKEEEIHAAVDHLNVETIVSQISSLNSEVSKVLAEISAKMTKEVNQLYQLRAALALEQKELEKLHKIDIVATAMDQLLSDYAQRKQLLEAEMASKQQEWSKDEQLRMQSQKESDEALKKERERESEEYNYRKSLERKKAQDKFDEALRLHEKESQENFEKLNKQWQMREAALQEKEKAYTEALKAIEEMPARLKKEVDAAVQRATKETEQKLGQEMALLKKDYDAEKKLAEVKVKTLEDLVTRQNSQIEGLQHQVEHAKKQVEEIAIKAIEGASEKRALEHVNLIAREQAKARGAS